MSRKRKIFQNLLALSKENGLSSSCISFHITLLGDDLAEIVSASDEGEFFAIEGEHSSNISITDEVDYFNDFSLALSQVIIRGELNVIGV